VTASRRDEVAAKHTNYEGINHTIKSNKTAAEQLLNYLKNENSGPSLASSRTLAAAAAAASSSASAAEAAAWLCTSAVFNID
jgi:hypothetical protein